MSYTRVRGGGLRPDPQGVPRLAGIRSAKACISAFDVRHDGAGQSDGNSGWVRMVRNTCPLCPVQQPTVGQPTVFRGLISRVPFAWLKPIRMTGRKSAASFCAGRVSQDISQDPSRSQPPSYLGCRGGNRHVRWDHRIHRQTRFASGFPDREGLPGESRKQVPPLRHCQNG